MERMRVIEAILGVLVFLSMLPCASAVTLDVDPDAMPGWKGTLEFYNSELELLTEMDYAVFEPGDFSGADPSSGTEYVYAYQLFQCSTSKLSAASVGVLEDSGAANPDTDPAYGVLGGVVPTAPTPVLTTNSFYTSFLTPQLSADDHSVVLLFTSPYGPMETDASVINSGMSSQVYGAPTPIPEPASLSLLLALTGLAALRRRRV